jgi:hypothetical protein
MYRQINVTFSITQYIIDDVQSPSPRFIEGALIDLATTHGLICEDIKVGVSNENDT